MNADKSRHHKRSLAVLTYGLVLIGHSEMVVYKTDLNKRYATSVSNNNYEIRNLRGALNVRVCNMPIHVKLP